MKCPEQEVKSTPTKKQDKVVFDTDKCASCPLSEQCNIFQNIGIYYFTHQDYLQNKRTNNINKIPKEQRKIRPNVEATIKEFKNKTRAGKLKVRGIFKAKFFAYAMEISINFGRIYRLIMSNKEKFGVILTKFNNFIVQILVSLKLTQFAARKNKKSNHFSNIAFIRD